MGKKKGQSEEEKTQEQVEQEQAEEQAQAAEQEQAEEQAADDSQDEPRKGIVGDQGDLGESVPRKTVAGGFDPSRPVATSSLPPDAQSGVPSLIGGGNEGIEAQEQYRGSVDPSQGDLVEADPATAPDANDPDEDGDGEDDPDK